MITAIIGANYGDEGKGLATNYFTREGKNLVVRHNGGAQSGHTVEIGDKRFVFHELSSGSFNGADTFWDSTYHPDLYALDKECQAFTSVSGKLPCIYATKYATITIIDDIILNQYRESHYKRGSCGMGIWECICRNNAGYSLSLAAVSALSVPELTSYLKEIRIKHVAARYYNYKMLFAEDLNVGKEYVEMLADETVLSNYAVAIKENLDKYVHLVDHLENIIDNYDNVVFESGQGLCIDGDLDFLHGTPSKTGLFNISNRLSSIGKHLDEAVYVTRTYLTRHGLGDFVDDSDLITGYQDQTNLYNPWQGDMRYGRFSSLDELAHRIEHDCNSTGVAIKPHLLVTHANVHDGNMLTTNGLVPISDMNYEKIYVSDNRFTVSAIITKAGQ